MLDRRAADLEFARRVRVRRLEPALGDLEEPRGARVQRLRGQGLETLRELALDERGPFGCTAFDHPGFFFGGAGPLVRGPGPARQVRGGGGEPTAGEQVSDRCSDDDPEQQSGKQQNRTHMQGWSHRRWRIRRRHARPRPKQRLKQPLKQRPERRQNGQYERRGRGQRASAH
jgi:hypothetical protein